MKQEEFIRKYGKAAYEKHLQQKRDWYAQHREGAREISKLWAATNRERARENSKRWVAANPEKDKAHNHDINRKGGKYYDQKRQHQMTGTQHGKELVRGKHRRLYRAFKRIVAPESQIHHDWLNDGTSNYRGVALVEADSHLHGFIDVIKNIFGFGDGWYDIYCGKEILGHLTDVESVQEKW